MVRFFKRNMSKERKELSREEMIDFFLWTIILVLPWVMSPTGDNIYALGKAIFMWLLCPILTVLVIKDRKKIKYDLISKIVGGYFVILTISTIFAQNKIVAIFGEYTRFDGLVMQLFYIVLFLSARVHLKINKRKIKALFISANTMAIYSLIQFYYLDPILNNILDGRLVGNAIGTIGNRNFMGTFILIFLVASTAAYVYYGERSYLISGGILFASLLATLTRSCWVGFSVVLVVGLITILKRNELYKRVGVIVLVFTLIFITMGVSSSGRVFGRTESLKNEIVNKEERSGSGRIEIWQITSKVVKDNFFIGVGVENLEHSLLTDYRYIMDEFIERVKGVIDKAHNEYLHIMACSGVFALLTYLIFIALILRRIIKNYNDDRYKIIGLVIVGYLVQAFFNISVVGVAPLFWILLGLSTNEEEVKKLRLN